MPPRRVINKDKRNQKDQSPPKKKGTGQGKIPVISDILKNKV